MFCVGKNRDASLRAGPTAAPPHLSRKIFRVVGGDIENAPEQLGDIERSVATLLSYIERINDSLQPWKAGARKQLMTRPALHVDETGFRVDKKNWWLHVATDGSLTLKYLHRKRGKEAIDVNRHSTVTHYQRPNMTHPQEGGTGGEVSEILFFSAKSKRHPSLIYSMQIIPVCLSIVARRKGVSATRRGGLNWTPISLLVGHP